MMSNETKRSKPADFSDDEPSMFLPETNDRVLCCQVLAKMTSKAYEHAGEVFRETLKKNGEIRIVVNYINFDGWDDDATKLDMGFNLEFGPHFTKMALVNPPPVMISQIKMKASTFPRLNVRYYEADEYEQAVRWANED